MSNKTTRPAFRPVPQGADIVGENNILGTANRFSEFLFGGEQGANGFDQTLARFEQPLNILADAFSGDLSGAANPLLTRSLDDTLQAESVAKKQLEEQLGQLPQQFGSDRLRAQLLSDFGRKKAALPTDLIMNIIQNFSPFLQQALQGQTQRAGIQGAALQGSQNFNRVSKGRQAQIENQQIAGIPPQQSSNGIAALAGMFAPAALGAVTGGLGLLPGGVGAGGGLAAGLGLGTLNLSPDNKGKKA